MSTRADTPIRLMFAPDAAAYLKSELLHDERERLREERRPFALADRDHCEKVALRSLRGVFATIDRLTWKAPK